MSSPEDTRYGCWYCGVAGPREAFVICSQRYRCANMEKCLGRSDATLSDEETTEILEKLERGEF